MNAINSQRVFSQTRVSPSLSTAQAQSVSQPNLVPNKQDSFEMSLQAQMSYDFQEQLLLEKEDFVRDLPLASVQFTPQAVDKEAVSRQFAKQRQHVLDTYKGDELYEKLDHLSRTFEDVIRESMKATFGFFTVKSENGEALGHELADHVEKQTDLFLTTFMADIQSQPFEVAFQNTLQAMGSELSTRNREFSWDDVMRLMNA